MSSEHAELRMLHESFPHLSADEWSTVLRMAERIGETAVGVMLTTLDVQRQRESILAFVQREAAEARRACDEKQGEVAELRQQVQLLIAQQHQQQRAAAQPRAESVKLDVSKFRGAEGESLLRWLVELDAAISARGFRESHLEVAFAMSVLAGRAKTWAFGRRLADPHCFQTYEEFKHELKQAFEPPKSELRARSEFLAIRQGKRDVHTYSQLARYLISCIVYKPVDDQTQVVTFMAGLNDGPVKTYLFRQEPETLEEAIVLATQEDYSLGQAQAHSAQYRPQRYRTAAYRDTAEPMDLSTARVVSNTTRNSQFNGNQNGRRSMLCHRCKRPGHRAYECMAPRPAQQNAGRGNAPRSAPFRAQRLNPQSNRAPGSEVHRRQGNESSQ